MKIKFVTFITTFAVIAGLFFTTNELDSAQKLKWHTFNKGYALSLKQSKPMIVDFYADWCGWCKKMDKDTFENPAVKKILAKDFILVRIDVESDQKITYRGNTYSTRQFQTVMQVSGLPTLAFFDREGKVITLLPGYVTPDKFTPILSYIETECYTKEVAFKDYLSADQKCIKN